MPEGPGEHTEHIPEGSRGCDFSRLSQGLGYSVCLCELMLLPSQCFSDPVDWWVLFAPNLSLRLVLDYAVSRFCDFLFY